ncbi:MAG: hypothetical protein DWQ06_16655 [Calditrichaeota bacterium]|nr:MAG: hypothetical protein DWQ06_16655 [Calditrichota bacterium]
MNTPKEKNQPPKRQGKDDMNLVEFPFASISNKKDLKQSKTITRIEKDHTGEKIVKKWTIGGHFKLGLPTPSTEDTLLILIELCKIQSNFTNKSVFFTRAELLRRMNYANTKQYYNRLENDLKILSAVKIEYENSFWHNEKKQLLSRGVGIVQEYQIYNESGANSLQQPLFKSFIIFTDSYFESLQAQYIKNLDSHFYFSLSFPIAKKLFRILDKRFYIKSPYFFELRDLAENFIGLETNQEIKHLKQKITKASKELIKKGFLDNFSYKKIAVGKYQVWFFKASDEILIEESPSSQIENIGKKLLEIGINQRAVDTLIEKREKALAEFVQTKYNFKQTSFEDYLLERITIFELVKNLSLSGQIKAIKSDGAYLWNLIKNDEVPESYLNKMEEEKSKKEVLKSKEKIEAKEKEEEQKRREKDLQERELFFKEFDKFSDEEKSNFLEIAKKKHFTTKYRKLKLEPQEIKQFLEENTAFFVTFYKVINSGK